MPHCLRAYTLIVFPKPDNRHERRNEETHRHHIAAQNIAYLTQDAYLFSGTIADNLSMASDNEELGSSVLSELSGNSLDLSKEVEEAGANLSPGQQQKISLARALIKKAELLILDEPGNHLDKEGLDWLGDFLVRTDKAVVLISHDETLTSRIG